MRWAWCNAIDGGDQGRNDRPMIVLWRVPAESWNRIPPGHLVAETNVFADRGAAAMIDWRLQADVARRRWPYVTCRHLNAESAKVHPLVTPDTSKVEAKIADLGPLLSSSGGSYTAAV